MKKILTLIGVLICFLGFGQFGTDVFTIGSDNASNYGGSWTNGSTQGSGFGAWTLSSSGAAGHYIGGTGQGGTSFGIYSDGFGAFAYGERNLSSDLKKGETISFDLGHTATINGEIFMQLLDDGAPVFTLKFVGGGTNWLINDGGVDFSSG